MTKYVVTFDNRAAKEAVFMYTANAALQRGDGRAVATEDDEAILNGLAKDGKRMLRDVFGRYYKSWTETLKDGGMVEALTYEMPDNWGGNNEDVADLTVMFMRNFILTKWFEMNGTGERFEEMAREAAQEIKRILDKRVRPER